MMAVDRRADPISQWDVDVGLRQRKTDAMLECFLDDDEVKMSGVFRNCVSNYNFLLMEGKWKLPKLLRNGATPLMMAAFFGAIKCAKKLSHLSADPKAVDKRGLTVAHFACAGGLMDMVREVDHFMGADLGTVSRDGTPAKFACEFGRDEVVMSLWTKGNLLASPPVGWLSEPGGDADVLCAAALNGHLRVLQILHDDVGLRFASPLCETAPSAVTSACRNGHDAVLDEIHRRGAQVPQSALPVAIKSGSFRCVDWLLSHGVAVSPEIVELAVSCGHSDVLARLLPLTRHFGCAWIIAWGNGFRDGLRVLQNANAKPQWTPSGIQWLMERPGKASDFAMIVSPKEFFAETLWNRDELLDVLGTLLSTRTLEPSFAKGLLKHAWPIGRTPFTEPWMVRVMNLAFDAGADAVGDFAMKGNPEIQDLTVPRCIRTLGSGCYEMCPALRSVVLEARLTRVSAYAFYHCALLTNVSLPAGLESIGCFAFAECPSLASIVFPPGLKSMDASAFHGCTCLTQVQLPPSLGSIGKCVFGNCSSIRSITSRAPRLSMGCSAFSSCQALTEIAWSGGWIELAEEAFSFCGGLVNLVLPFGSKSVCRGLLMHCVRLQKVWVPAGAREVCDRAFSGCLSLRQVDLPYTILSIGSEAFAGCSRLTELTMPADVEDIHESAFEHVQGILKLRLLNEYLSEFVVMELAPKMAVAGVVIGQLSLGDFFGDRPITVTG
jgi:hypothetical protein